jgi:hypothetical protein
VLLLLASLLLAEAGPYGHVTSSVSSVRFSADSVLGTFVNLELADGHWRGTLGRGRVDWTLEPQRYNGDPSFVLEGSDVEVVYVHHEDMWYARRLAAWHRGHRDLARRSGDHRVVWLRVRRHRRAAQPSIRAVRDRDLRLRGEQGRLRRQGQGGEDAPVEGSVI